MYVVVVLGILAFGVTALRWMEARDKAIQRSYEYDGK